MTAEIPGLSTLLRRTLEQTLIPSPNVVELAPAKAAGFVNRLAPGHDDVAETFHMNTRLSRQQPDVRLRAGERAAVRQWYFTTCARYRDDDLVLDDRTVRLPHESLNEPLRAMLSAFGAAGSARTLLYRCDLMVVLDGAVCRQPPGEDAVWVERRLSAEELDRFHAVAADEEARQEVGAALAVFAVVGVPWRSMVDGGPRGYRRMLMDAGVLLDVLGGLAQHHGLRPSHVHDFYDDEVDELFYLDGLEHSVLALVPVAGGAE